MHVVSNSTQFITPNIFSSSSHIFEKAYVAQDLNDEIS